MAEAQTLFKENGVRIEHIAINVRELKRTRDFFVKYFVARTVQMDIQIMRSDKLGYNAPIEVYDRIYYRYADPGYSISEMPLTIDYCKLIKKAITLLAEKEKDSNEETMNVLYKVQNRLRSLLNYV